MTKELPDKYKTCDWLWTYGSIGLTKEHIKRLNNAINILESLNEHTDAKYLKEIKNKLLEDTPEQEIEKTNTDAIIEKALKWYCLDCACNDNCAANHKCAFWSFFKDYLEGNDKALPPKISNTFNPDGSTTENYRYRHIIERMQDDFIEKAENFLEDKLTEKDCKFNWGEWTKVKSGDTPIASFMRAFKKYMKGV